MAFLVDIEILTGEYIGKKINKETPKMKMLFVKSVYLLNNENTVTLFRINMVNITELGSR